MEFSSRHGRSWSTRLHPATIQPDMNRDRIVAFFAARGALAVHFVATLSARKRACRARAAA